MNIYNTNTLKRPLPSSTTLRWRKSYLSELGQISPNPPSTEKPAGFSLGNSKTGTTGSLYKTIYVWNLPSVATCPGASEWCLEKCYNADPREDVFPVKEWGKNWWWIINHPVVLFETLQYQILKAMKPCAVRIHSSGDFFSPEYINFWIKIAYSFKTTMFWAYTRTWVRGDFLPLLEEFHSLENVQLFASCDKSMPNPPDGWRRSLVLDNEFAADCSLLIDPKVYICPEQFGRIQNCASCGFCIEEHPEDVLFFLH